jgi:hypothetical protein
MQESKNLKCISQVHIRDCKNLVQEREKSGTGMRGSLISIVTTQRGFEFRLVRARYDHLHVFNWYLCIFQLAYVLALALHPNK